MKSKTWLIALLCLYLAVGGLLISGLFSEKEPWEADLTALNRIAQQTASQWKEQAFQTSENCPYDYAVIDHSGALLYQTSHQVPVLVTDAIRSRNTIMDVQVDGNPVGKVIIVTNNRTAWEQQQKHLAYILTGMFLLVLLSCTCYLFYLERTIFGPFKRLKTFTRNIAMGNLDAPLPMDKDHVFGAFTESFDLMREQLSEARQKEAQANQSKKELAASLSHDIKTPVTSIKLISELLLVTETRETVREKLQTIYNKSDQIDLLITDMLHSALEELGQMNVHLSEESSQILEPMIRQADLCGQVSMKPIPECLLLLDPLRIEQVIDNLLSNAYKYAGTAITIESEIISGYLRLEFQDYGPGVLEEELPKLFQKFYRGSHGMVRSKQGSGLGLYIAHHLMKAMNGDIQYFNREDGFTVELLVPLVTK